MAIIALTTDFGLGSPYVAAIKGVILSINPAATVVDLTHAVPPQDIRSGAVVLRDTALWFPPETIHVVVIDPGVGTDREIVYARLADRHFIAPDNGVLSLVAQATPPELVVSLGKRKFWLPQISATFHGRDIMAPVAARLSLGLDPRELGEHRARLHTLDWPMARLMPDRIEGHVEYIDTFGNLITNITAEMLAQRPPHSPVRVCLGRRVIRGIHRTYAECPAGKLVALVSSNGRLELAVSCGSAAAKLAVGVGTPVVVRWE